MNCLKHYKLLIFIVLSFQQLVAQTNYTLIGNSFKSGTNCYTLTNNTATNSGALWSNTKLNLAKSFHIYTKLNLGCTDAGGTGIAFVLQDSSNTFSSNSFMGYNGFSQSLAVEFDTYQDAANSDPVDDHLALIINGTSDHNSINNLVGPIEIKTGVPNLEDCSYHDVHFYYNADSNLFKVYVDCELRINLSINLLNDVFTASDSAYFGFTANNYPMAFNDHKVCFDYVSLTDTIADAHLCKGTVRQFNAGIGTSYVWGPPVGISNISIRNPNITAVNTTQINVQTTNACGIVRTDTFNLEVSDTANVSISGTLSVCDGDSVALPFNTAGTGPFKIKITGLDTLIINAAGNNIATNAPVYLNPTVNTQYNLIFSGDTNGCIGTPLGSVTVNTTTLTNFTVTNSDAVCNGDCNGQASFTPPVGSTPINYLWPDNSTLNYNSSLCAGNYTITVTYNNNQCTDSFNITVNEPLPLSIQPIADDTICFGNTLNVTASASGGVAPLFYTWAGQGVSVPSINLSPQVTTPFTVAVTDANNCPAVQTSFVVYVEAPLQGTVGTNGNGICRNSSATLYATGNGGNAPYNFMWIDEHGIPYGSANQITVSPLDTTTYFVIMTDACNSTPDTITYKLNVEPVPDLGFVITPVDSCAPAEYEFEFTGYRPNFDYSIVHGDGTINTSATDINYHGYSGVGVYDVAYRVQTSLCDTTVTLPAALTVYRKPIADFYHKPTTVTKLFPHVEFVDQSYDAIFWEWYIEGDLLSTTPNWDVNMPDSGIYKVILYVENEFGCWDELEYPLEVEFDWTTLWVPNAFTPNGDGKNETFKPKINYDLASDYVFQIFDRYGQKIFETRDVKASWDGNFENGTPVQPGNYVYHITFTDANGELVERHGYLNLIK